MSSLRTLLAHVVDYAGLFPPAALAMGDAARAYGAYRASDERWMLGRFVVPAARLAELAAAIPSDTAGAPWALSVLLGPDLAADVAHTLPHANTPRTHVSALELRVSAPNGLARATDAAHALGVPLDHTFCELPSAAEAESFADAAAAGGLALKLRTGGVTADAFPPAADVARFLAACVARGVPFKLTAGLHHPVRDEYPLTYEAGCPRGTMHGFLNVLAATARLAAGDDAAAVAPLLEERDAHAVVDYDALDGARRLFVSFGSCSFTEPVHDLRALGLLPHA